MTTEKLTDDNFDNQIKSSEKPALVDFFADWCEPCKMLAPVLEKIAEEMKEKIVLLKANLDDIPKTAEKFGIEKIPTVILFKDGAPISGFVGLLSEASIKEWLLNILQNPQTKTAPNSNVKEMVERYDNYAKSNGFRLNPDSKIVEGIMNGLLANEKKYGKRYCPCRRVSENEDENAKKICPCAFHKEEIQKNGHCLCNLFVK